MNAGRTWYEEVGSIAHRADSDVYLLTAPGDDDGTQAVMTVNVQSLKAGGLIPAVTVSDSEGNQLASQIIVNGNGEHVLQVAHVEPEERYFVSVKAANPTGVFASGNYKLAIDFGSKAVQLDNFSSGFLDNTKAVEARSLHVASPQLFHFLLSVEGTAESTPTVITVDLFDESDELIYTLRAPSGATRSAANPLLAPGTYTVRVGTTTQPGVASSVNYALRGLAFSNPLGVVPVDPTAEPVFQCDGVQ